MFRLNRIGTLFLAFLSLLTPVVHADTNLKFANFIEELAISGDFRLRYDNEHFQTKIAGAAKVADDRSRFRMRLRVATDFKMPSNVYVKLRFASGIGEQVSTNQSFGSLGTQKTLYIDRAYVTWQPVEPILLQGGKMANPLWTLYCNDAIWDGDLSPEGTGESFNVLLGGVRLFANALQMVADEDSSTAADQYLFSEQIGGEIRLPFESRFKLGFAYHDWHNENNTPSGNFTGVSPGTNGQPLVKMQEGNRRAGGVSTGTLVNQFAVGEVMAELSGWIFNKPLSLQGIYLKNSGVKDSYQEKQDTGYQAGAIIGKAKDARTWELAYFYKYLETDATLADIADSDFGDGGTNRRGHIMWIAYAPTDWFVLQTKYFQTQNIEKDKAVQNDIKGSMDRLQVDAMLRF